MRKQRYRMVMIIALVLAATYLAADETACIHAARINAELERIETDIAVNQAMIDKISLAIGGASDPDLIDRFMNRKNLKDMHLRIEENERRKRRQQELLDQRGHLYRTTIPADRALEILCGAARIRNLEEISRQRERLARATNVEEKMRTEKRLLELDAERKDIEKKYVELNRLYREKSP